MGGVLDDAAAIARYDSEGMLAAIPRLAGQLTDGWARSRALELPASHRGPSTVVVLGMGGSAIGADLVRGIFSDRLRVPLVTVRDYDLPRFAQPPMLVVAASHSGATEETLSALSQAISRGCPVAAITTGGPLLVAAHKGGLPYLEYTGESQPRASVGSGIALLAGLLERAGCLDAGEQEFVDAAEAVGEMAARCGPGVATESNPAKQLAWSLVDRLPVVEAGGFLAAVARRWKTQLNENSKSIACWEELPEATHNAVVGYEQPETMHERTFVALLASPDDHPRVALRRSLTADLLAERQVGHEVVVVGGRGRLAQAASAIALGDFTSVYLAVLYGLDPTPVAAISYVKEHLALADPHMTG
ncbi:MAG TPA: bifunctional phosphoglucose/phosphomannose isomerase [Candidatus Acidoferrales bacterium]|nr:bifunctional phosphoglucose/phosphomannose isomerase [Candidatus Acidoferrales bacterium]